MVLIFCFSDGQLGQEIGKGLGINKWSTCTTHFKTDDGMCKDEFGKDWKATETWEKCGAGSLGKKVLCKPGKWNNISSIPKLSLFNSFSILSFRFKRTWR